jgi:hypothetical protein
MKSFLLIIPFALWFFCFRHFFTGHLNLQADAVSYADHIGFYTDNLSRGIFPLWDPTWFSGAPNDFFLRRIGDVNPFLFLIVLLKWFGVPSASAYLVFLGVYYFLAGWAFYLITRFLLADRFFAFTAYVLFLFSSWGSEIFYNYIIIIFVPIIWFFYFLLCFSRTPQRASLLGMCWCAGLIVTTYIPFFFLTILAIFSFLYVLFYGNEWGDFFKRLFKFFYKNKVFAGFCIVFLLVSCIPGLAFYKESKSGEFVLPDRHSGANSSSAVAVGLKNVASGDIINHGYFDRIFDDHAHLDMGDIYIPYIFFLVLLSTAFARADKLIYFLLFNILCLSLITITSAAGVHRFLYDHIIFFKFIRNIYYFFWLAMLPMGILLSVVTFKSLLTAISSSSRKTVWLVYIVICHLIFVLFLCGRHGVLWGAWAAIILSLCYFLVYFYGDHKISYPAGFCLLLLAVFVQSAQVYGALDNKLFQFQRRALHLDEMRQNSEKTRLGLYYASSWFSALVDDIDPRVLDDYRKHQFVFYDNVIPYKDSPEIFQTLQTTMAANTNVAFVSRRESGPADWRRNDNTALQADLDPVSSGKLSVLRSDANTLKLTAHLNNSQFLVINDNYNTQWHALINGHQARLLRANFAFKGLWVPSGDSSIVLHFSTLKRYMFHFGLIALFGGVFLYLLVLFKKERPGSYV